MTDWCVRFIGHVDETRRPTDFPREVYSDLYVRADTAAGLKSAINSQAQVFINEGCMIVPKDPGGMEDMISTAQDSRWIVPFHMITYISTITKRIIGEIPQLNEDSKPTLIDGTKLSIQ